MESIANKCFICVYRRSGAGRRKKAKSKQKPEKSDGAGALMRELNEISVMCSIVNLIEPEARETEGGLGGRAEKSCASSSKRHIITVMDGWMDAR